MSGWTNDIVDWLKVQIAYLEAADRNRFEEGALAAYLETLQQIESRIRERVVEGKRAKRERGGFVGGKPPYGYRLVGKDHIEPCEAEMWLIGRARILCAGGYSWQRIADNLNEARYRTRNGTPFQARQIGRWLSRPAVPEEAIAARPTPPAPIERPTPPPPITTLAEEIGEWRFSPQKFNPYHPTW